MINDADLPNSNTVIFFPVLYFESPDGRNGFTSDPGGNFRIQKSHTFWKGDYYYDKTRPFLGYFVIPCDTNPTWMSNIVVNFQIVVNR